MASTFQGQLVCSAESRFAIVASRFNDLITSRLIDGAIETIVRHGGDSEKIWKIRKLRKNTGFAICLRAFWKHTQETHKISKR